MNEDKLQLPITKEQAQQMGQTGSSMSMDDMAAMLGFITSIGQMQHQAQSPEAQPEAQQEPQQVTPQDTPPEAPPQESPDEDLKRDDAMEKEIADIRAELERLKAEDTKENDTTGTTNQDTSTAS